MQARSLTDQCWGDPCELDGGGGVELGVRLIVNVACGMYDVSVIAMMRHDAACAVAKLCAVTCVKVTRMMIVVSGGMDYD